MLCSELDGERCMECCSSLLCVAVSCSVLQCVAERAVCCSELKYLGRVSVFCTVHGVKRGEEGGRDIVR